VIIPLPRAAVPLDFQEIALFASLPGRRDRPRAATVDNI